MPPTNPAIEPARRSKRAARSWAWGGVLAAILLVGLGTAPTAQAQTVTQIHPESGAPGSTLRIHGNNLGSVTTVTVGGEPAPINNASSTLLDVQVPSGTGGLAEVQVGGTGPTAPSPFFVVTSGSGTFSSFASRTGPTNGEAAAADYDGDDTTEVVLSGAGGAQVYTPDGTGGIRTENEGLVALTGGTVDFGDVDNDGDLDLLQTGEDLETKQTILYQQDLNGDLLSVSTSLANFSRSAADFGDLDQDGDLDLVLAGITQDNLSLEDDTTTIVYKNDGTGAFRAADTLLGLQNGTVDLVDVNNDGALDLHMTGTDSTGTGRSVLYTNSGGAFTSRMSIGIPVKGGAVDYADVDGDGDRDFVVAGSGTGGATTALYTNTYAQNGTVGFSYDSSESQLAAVADGTVTFAEVEGDGDPDLLVTGAGTAQMVVNDGAGNFSAVADGIAGVENSAAVFGGLNGDGKLDLFVHDGTAGTATFYNGVVPFRLAGTSPPRNALGVPPTASIDLTFSKTVPDTAGLADSLVVRGTQSGPIEDDDGLVGGGDNQLTYTPAQSLAPGENVTVTARAGLRGEGGSALDTAETFRYTVGASSGPAAFPASRAVDETNVDGAISVAAGDIDGDGNQDLVVGALGANTVRWYAGDGSGGFDGGTEVASGVNYPRDIALADLDRDGTLDVLVMEGSGESSDGDDIIRSHLNTNGDGSSFSTQDVATSSDNLDDPRAIDTGDLTGDGVPDVVAVSQDNNSVYAYRNDDAGSGAYTELPIQGSGADDPRAVDVADVDGDGALDVIVGSVSDDAISWFRNDGTGAFGAERVIAASGAMNPRDVDAANLDSDARLEILAAQRGTEGDGDDGAVAWYDNTSSGWTANTIVSADSVLAAAPADLNADGRLDVIAGSVTGDSLVWYENLGEGRFGAGDPLEAGANEVRDVLAADFDGDGSLDPGVAAYAENALQVYPNREPLVVTGTTPSLGAPSVDSTADITVSFNQALLNGTASSANVGVSSDRAGQISGVLSESGNQLTFSPDGALTPGARVTVSVDSSVASTGGIPLADPFTFTFRVQTGRGTGGFTATNAGVPGVREGDLDWGDFDGDGDLDLVVVGDSTYATDDINDGMAAVYENTGSGFSKVESVAGVKAGASAEWGDYDGDGVLDLVVAGYNAAQSPSYRTIVYHNGGNGAFDDSTSLAAGVQNSEVAWGDYDGDGDLDLAVAGTDLDTGEFTKIYRYDRATDTFTDINAGLLTMNRAGLDWGDYDQDGDLDLVAAGSDNGTPATTLYRNDRDVDEDGAYEFTAISSGTTGLPTSKRASAQWGDYDRDGLPELLLSGDKRFGEPIIQIFEYNGDDTFRQDQDLSIGASGRGVKGGEAVWGDYDGDRDLDVAAAGNNGFESEAPAASVFGFEEGAGTYGEIGAGLTAVDTSAVSWGDFDGDGILDLAVTGATGTGGGTLETTLYKQEPAPTATAEAPDSVHIHAAELKGSVDLTGVTTRIYFALTPPSGTPTLIPTDTLTGTGTNTVRQLTPDTLQAQSTYEYAVVAATRADSVVSTPVSFTTQEPRIYVDATATGADDGLSWGTAFPNLQSALDLARRGDAIWVAAGTYHPDEGPVFPADTSTAHFALKDGVQVYGGFSGGEASLSGRRVDGRVDPSKTVLSGDVDGDGTLAGNSYHVVVSPRGIGPQTRLDGFTITGGHARASGVEGTPLDVDGDEFRESDRGGGLYVNGRNGAVSNPTLAHLAVTNNRAERDGGGLYLDAFEFGEASPELGNVIVAENRAARGGGLAIVAGAASEGGGGTSDPLIANALFRGNQAAGGGSTGGAVFVRFEFGSAVTPRFVHTTLVNNDAGGDGGGLYTSNLNYNESADSVFVHNSILSGNTAGGAGNQIYSGSATQGSGIGIASSLVEGSGGSGAWTLAVGGDEGGNLDAAPIFVDAGGADLRLNWASPVIEEGAAALVPGDSADVDNDGNVTEGLPVDQRGSPRQQGGQVDMGAYEGGAVPSGPTLYVDRGAGADSSTYGGTWGTPYRTLQAGLAAAKNRQVAGAPFEQVQVAAGVYYPDEGPGVADGDTTASFRLVSNTPVLGGYPSGGGTRDASAHPTVLSGDIDQDDTVNGDGVTLSPADTTGNNSLHVVTMRQQEATVLDGVVVTAGQADGALPGPGGYGGGMLVEYSAPTIRNVRFRGNWAAGGGGGLHVQNFSSARVEGTLLRGNGTGGNGGAVGARNTAVVLDDVTVVDNRAAGSGGGLALQTDSDAGPDTLRSVTMSGNVAGATGGGAWTTGTQPVFAYNSVFSGNNASGGAGLHAATDAATTITNSTFSNNTASNAGGAVLVDSTSRTTAILQNTILWGNAGVSGRAVQVASGGTASFVRSILDGGSAGVGGTGTINAATDADTLAANPLFANADGADNTPGTLDDDLRLNWASPAIDRGDSGVRLDVGGAANHQIAGVSTDRGGTSRVQGTRIDIGAHEGGAAPSGTDVVYVDAAQGADAATSGGTWSTPYRTLQAALTAARNAKRASQGVPFRTVRVAAGTYHPDEGPGLTAGDSSQSFTLLDSVAVYGGYPSGGGTRDPDPQTNGTVLSGEIGAPSDTSDNTQHVVRARGVGRTTVLDGFTITRGNATGGIGGFGGGLLLAWDEISQVAPTLRNLRIKENYARSGAGLAMFAPPPLNESDPLLGEARTSGAEAQASGSGGGGGARPLLIKVDLVDNVAAGGAGGVSLVAGTGTGAPVLQNVRFLGNEADQAGAFGVQVFSNATAAPEMANVLVSGNRASADSAVAVLSADTDGTLRPRLTNTTWAQNAAFADSLGTLIEVRGDSVDADVQVANSVLWGNAARTTVGSPAGATTLDASVVEGGWSGSGAGVVDADPRYVNPDGGDGTPGTLDDSLQVLGNSPALNRGGTRFLVPDRGDLDADGDTTETVSQGLGGAARVLAGQVDAGAYEGAESPSVGAAVATSVADSSATLAGTVVPYAPTANVTVEVVPTGGGTAQTVDAASVSGTDSVDVSASVTGLAPSTRYEYRLIADDGTRSTTSPAAFFTTTASGPVATADPASAIQDSSATLNGTVNPGGAPARVYVNIEEGPTSDSLLVPVDTLDTNLLSDQAVTLTTPDTLLPGAEYRYQIVAASSADSVASGLQSFVTNPSGPTGRVQAATSVSAGGATLNAVVNPAGAATRVYFDLENTATGDSSVYAADTLGTNLLSDGAVSVATPDPLAPATEYSVEVSAANSADSVSLGTTTFSTAGAVPVAQTEAATSVADSSAVLNATVNPGGTVARVYFALGRPGAAGRTLLPADTLSTDLTSDRAVSLPTPDTLRPGTSYETAAVVATTVDSVAGDTVSFGTRPSAPKGAPDGATAVTAVRATLEATVNPGGAETRVYYDLENTATGDSSVYAADTITTGVRSEQAVSVVTPDTLRPGTGYTYEVSAANAADSVSLGTASFTTSAAAPVATIEAATAVADSSARLQARVNPQGGATTVAFEYRNGLGPRTRVTGAESPLNGLAEQPDSAAIGGLRPGTEYHYRAIASSDAGADTTAEQAFVTDVVAPVVRADSVTGRTESGATLYGTVNPGGGAADVWFRYHPSGQPSADDTVAVAGGAIEGVRDTTVQVSVGGLDSGTGYAAEVVAANNADTTRSGTLSFSTENAPPVAAGDTVQTQEDATVTVSVLANDTADGTLDPATVAVVDSPSIGSVQADGKTGALTYRPDRNANGTDSLRYVVSDNAGQQSNEAGVVLRVAPVNDAPVARADTATAREGGRVTVPVLANDSDVEGRLDTASVSVVSGPARGRVTNVADGKITYAPDASGRDSLRYRVLDRSPQQAKADTATVRLEVRAVALVAQPDTHRLGVAQVGQPGAMREVIVENQGEVSLTDVQAALEGNAPGSFQIGTDSGENRLAPGEARTIQVRFRPDTTGRVQSTLAVRAAEGAVARTALIGRGARLTVQTKTLRREQRTEVDLVVEGGFNARSVRTLFARRGGASAYRAVALRGVDSTETRLHLQGRVPDTLVTTRGVDYYAVLAGPSALGGGRPDTLTLPAGGAREAQARPRHLPVQFDSLQAPIVRRYKPETYQMVTVPAEPDQGIRAALRSGFGGRYDRTIWRLLRWSGAEGDYREYPQIDSLGAGDAFWLITADGEPPTLAMAGRTARADTARRIPLRPGWNQVGSPYGYGVPWARVFAASGLDSTSVDGPVGYRDSTYQRGVRVLRPWRGYFVFNATEETQTLVVPPEGAGDAAKRKRLAAGPTALSGTQWAGGAPGGTPSDRMETVDRRAPDAPAEALDETGENPLGETGPGGPAGDGAQGASSASGADEGHNEARGRQKRRAAEGERPYTLRLEARSGAGRPSRVWLGLRRGAEPGRGPLDFAQVPPIEAGVRLSVLEPIEGRTVAHAGSFKPPAEGAGEAGREARGRSWSLVLRNRAEEARTVRLDMRSEGRLPAGQSRYVIDRTGERRLAPGQRVEVGPGQERRLRVLVGTEAYVRSESDVGLGTYTNELRGNYPNPFERQTTIGYTLGQAQEVTVEIYDVLGRRVQTLVDARERKAGLHQVRWAGENRYGTPVGSGVYFVRIRAEDFTETRKMVLVR